MKEEGQADRYSSLRINYVDHHNPDLILFDDGENELHRIDLTRLQTTESMHKLMLLLGLKEGCRDVNPACPTWATQGECERNVVYMESSCRKSCELCLENETVTEDVRCRDISPAHDCQYWSTMGACDHNEAFMHINCARSCDKCSDAQETETEKDEL